MIRTQSAHSADDPLSLALRPPRAESQQQREDRVRQEAEAKLVSDRIDEDLRQQEKEMVKKRKSEIKLLLLGQAESGKSTLQKQFQLLYAPSTLDDERASWRGVVFFNVIRTVRRLLDAVDAIDPPTSPMSADPAFPEAGSSATVDMSFSPVENEAGPSNFLESSTTSSQQWLSPAYAQLSELRTRLTPLIDTEPLLASRLSGGVELTDSAKRRGGGVYVRTGWQSRALTSGDSKEADRSLEADIKKIGQILEAHQSAVSDLWSHSLVRSLIDKRKLKLEESAEFFLNNIQRVARADYIPTTDDILRARLQTMGIASHSFELNLYGKAVSWHLYDVGGSRGQRHTWIPYFDDANAIIFIAPMSAFDQYLEEDGRVNRINDSLQLFTIICSNKLLKNVHLVLFLNKTDILKRKIAAGIEVKKYIISYGDRPNDYEHVVDYFRSHFTQAHRRNNDARRALYTHLTSVVDTKATQGIITNVRDSVFRGYLQQASLV